MTRPDVGLWSAQHRAEAADLHDLVTAAAERFGDRPFLEPVEEGQATITFTDLKQVAGAVDALLTERGVPVGARVAMVLHNSTLAALLFLGVIAARRVLVPLNPKSGRQELEYILDRTSPGLVLHDPAVADRLSPELLERCGLPVTDEGAFVKDLLTRPVAPTAPSGAAGSAEDRAEADAEIVFTSGSSGTPKGVVLSHRSLLADAFALGQRFDFTPGERFLTVCPLFHNSGQVFTTLTPLWCGGVTTTVRSEVGMLRFWHYVDRFRSQWSLVVNAFLGLLLARSAPREGGPLKGLLSGGSRLSPELIDSFEAAFRTPVHQVYGLTETTSVSTCERDGRPRAVRGSAGVALPCSTIRVVAEDGTDAAPGEPGEVWISGDNLLSRYLDQPELTAQKFRDGWLRTGDLGALDGDGNLFILDRIDDMVFVGGENVYPSEIENLLPRLNGVQEGIATAVPHEVMGHELLLVYTPSPDTAADHAAWREALTEGLSTFKVPRQFVPVSALGLTELPRAANGKILRSRVRDLATAWASGAPERS